MTTENLGNQTGSWNSLELGALIDELAATPGIIAECTHNLDDTDARRKSVPERLSILENVAHIRDLELEATTVRIRRILSEANPALENFNGAAVIAAERYNEESLEDALLAFTLGRRRNVARLRTLSPSDLNRTATIDGAPVTLREILQRLSAHDQEHRCAIESIAKDVR